MRSIAREKYINDCVRKHFDCVKEKYQDRLICVMLCGSQNYNTDISTSDVDTKALVMPSVDDIINGKRVKSHEIDVPLCNDGHCGVHDFRNYVDYAFKSNMNFVECMFTDYILWNLGNVVFGDVKSFFDTYGNDIAFHDIVHSTSFVNGMIQKYLKKYKADFNIKSATNILRLLVQYEVFLSELKSKHRDYRKVLCPDAELTKFIRKCREYEQLTSEANIFYKDFQTKLRYFDTDFKVEIPKEFESYVNVDNDLKVSIYSKVNLIVKKYMKNVL